MMCVDSQKGIYVTPKYSHGPLLPIHVVKSTTTPQIECEVANCQQLMLIGGSSGNPGKECVHLERTPHADAYTPPASLTVQSLQAMKDKGLISKEWSEKCESMHKAALENLVDTVYPIFYGDMGYSKRWVFFSVYTDQMDNWCKFGRTRVTFDSVSGKWNCQCRGTGKSHRCLHRMLAMWWIFQESAALLLPNSDIVINDIDDLETEIHMSETEMASYAENDRKVSQMTNYLLTNKKIPPPHELPVDLRSKDKDPPNVFIPEEKTCPYCPGPTPPDLLPYNIITTQATVYGYTYIKKGK